LCVWKGFVDTLEIYAMMMYIFYYILVLFELLLFSFADTSVLPNADDPQVCATFIISYMICTSLTYNLLLFSSVCQLCLIICWILCILWINAVICLLTVSQWSNIQHVCTAYQWWANPNCDWDLKCDLSVFWEWFDSFWERFGMKDWDLV